MASKKLAKAVTKRLDEYGIPKSFDAKKAWKNGAYAKVIPGAKPKTKPKK